MIKKLKLSNICKIQAGGTPMRKNKEYWENGNINWCKISDLKYKYVNDTEEKITQKGLDKSSAKLLKKGTILYTIFATIGEVSILNIDSATNQAIAGLEIINDMADKEYLYYFLKSKKEEMIKIGRGVAQNNINLTILKELEIDVPDIEKQKEIANQLNKIQKLIDIKEEQKCLYEVLIKSKFVEMFGELSNSKYPTVKLSSIADVGSSHRVFTTEFVENGIPFYRGTEIGLLANQEKPKDCYYISEEHYFKICDDSTRPKIGDLLIPSICNKGQVWMVDTTEPFYYKDGRVLSISPKEGKINHKYFHQFMKYKTVKEYSKLGSGSTFAEFKIFILKDFDVILPPIELQNQFADIVKQIDKQKFEVQKNLEAMKNLQENLMNKYFN